MYIISLIYSFEMYVKIGKEFESMGVYFICIKDMVGIMSFKEVYEFVKVLKENVRVLVFFYIYLIIGFGILIYFKVVEVGVDGIDIVILSFLGGIF